MLTVILTLSILALIWFCVCYIVFLIICSPGSSNSGWIKKPKTNTVAKDIGSYSWLSCVEEISIEALDGISLCGYFAKQKPDAPWIVLIHGYKGRASRMAKYFDHLYSIGYNVLAVDLRGHGKSRGAWIGLGFLDKDDIHCWVQWIKKNENQPTIILYGTSMGGSASLIYGGCNGDGISGIISDCAPSDMPRIIRRVLSHRLGWLYKLIFPLLSKLVQLFAGFPLSKAAAIQYVDKISVPVLFIHGREDGFVPSYMAEALYQAVNAEKYIDIVDGADHMQSVVVDPQKYWASVDAFLQNVCKKT